MFSKIHIMPAPRQHITDWYSWYSSPKQHYYSLYTISYQQVDDVNENEETFRFHVLTLMILIAHLNDWLILLTLMVLKISLSYQDCGRRRPGRLRGQVRGRGGPAGAVSILLCAVRKSGESRRHPSSWADLCFSRGIFPCDNVWAGRVPQTSDVPHISQIDVFEIFN